MHETGPAVARAAGEGGGCDLWGGCRGRFAPGVQFRLRRNHPWKEDLSKSHGRVVAGVVVCAARRALCCQAAVFSPSKRVRRKEARILLRFPPSVEGMVRPVRLGRCFLANAKAQLSRRRGPGARPSGHTISTAWKWGRSTSSSRIKPRSVDDNVSKERGVGLGVYRGRFRCAPAPCQVLKLLGLGRLNGEKRYF